MDIQNPEQITPSVETSPKPSRRRRLQVIIITAAVLFLGLIFTGFGKHQISILHPISGGLTPSPTVVQDPDYALPPKEPNRLDVLILGIRGQNDPDAADGGPLLTDSIEIFSYDKVTHKSSLISLPRDLYVKIHDDQKDKLNTAYEYGYYHSSDSLQFMKDKISEITGVYIDEVVIFDFSSFKQIVDALGGIDVTLDQPFKETQQWGYEFSLPAGLNHLDGQSALYYARSRYTSDDFDRARRQQQIIFAIKDKLLNLNFISDPVKTFSILNLVRSDVKTTIGLWSVKQYLDLAHEVDFSKIQHTVISTDNLVMEGRANNAYILLPKGGNLSGIKKLFQDSLN
jgi:LCP family protein required for cell wall assembly